MQKRWRDRITVLIVGPMVVCYLGFILVFPKESAASVREALTICGEMILPSLFPFTCLSIFLYESKLSQVLKKPIAVAAKFLYRSDAEILLIWLISNLGGYPIGAQLIAKAKENGQIGDCEANRLLACSVNAGPAFTIVAVGCGILQSKRAGILLFCGNTAVSFLLSLFYLRKIPTAGVTKSISRNFTDALVDAITTATKSMLILSGFVVFFRDFYTCFIRLFGIPFGNIIGSLTEVTTAAFCLKNAPIGMMGLCLAFAGISVQFQVFVICRTIKINYRRFYFARILHALLAALSVTGLERLFPIKKDVIAVGTIGHAAPTKETLAFSFAIMVLSIVLMVYSRAILRQK